MSEPRIIAEDGRAALLLDGAVQSVAAGGEAGGYWPLLLPAERPASTLLLGLGGATVARLLHERFGALQMVGVEDDARVLNLARAQGWLDMADLDVAFADARAYTAGCAVRGERFALVVVDLFRDGGVPAWVCSRRFVALLAHVIAPGGLLTVNLSRGQGHASRLRRLARRFAVEHVAATGMNLVVHARPLPARRHVRRFGSARRSQQRLKS